MINANIEKMMRMMTEQFSQLASSSRKPGTFSSQLEVNPKSHAFSSSGANPSEAVRKVNAVLSLQAGREIDNQVRNPYEICMYHHQFFQNFSPPKISSSSKLGDATDGVPNNSDSPSPSKSPSNKEEPNEKDSSDLVDPLPPKGSSSPSSVKKVHTSLPLFPYRLKKKIKLMLIR